MLNKIKSVIASTPGGARKWRDHINSVYEEASGSPLGQRKADKLAARSLGLADANTYWGSLDTSDDYAPVRCAIDRLEDLYHERNGDSFRFFFPAFREQYTSYHDGRTVNCLTGINTDITLDNDTRRFLVVQTIKQDIEDLRESVSGTISCTPDGTARLFFGGNLAARAVSMVNLSSLASDALGGLVEGESIEVTQAKIRQCQSRYDDHFVCKVLRRIQAYELGRISAAIGTSPTFTAPASNQLHAVFCGEIRYGQLKP